MMNANYQNIINETQDPKYDELTVHWICIPKTSDDFQFTHRHVKINNYGLPVLRLYPNETKYLYKELYNYSQKVSDIKSQDGFEIVSLYNNDGEKVIEYNPSDFTITSYNITGSVVLKSSSVPNIFNESKFNDAEIDDKDLIIIVEKEPIITNIEWVNENPLYVEPNSSIPIKVKLTYDNDDNREYIDDNYIQFLHITNKCYLNIENNHFITTNQKGVTYVQFKAPNISNKITPKDLKVIVCNGREIPENAESKFKHTSSMIVDLSSLGEMFYIEEEITETKSITGTDKNITYSRIEDVNIRIEDDGVITLENSTVKPDLSNVDENYPRKTHLVVTSDKIDFPFYIDSDAFLIPVMVIKNIDHITLEVSKKDPFVGDIVQIKVEVHYSNNTVEDITHLCKFDYDDRFITIENHEEEDIIIGVIKCIAPGTTIISIKDADFANEFISTLDDIILTITQPITDMNLNKHELELIIGDSEQLEFTYTPENASYQALKWTSSEPDVVSVNDDGVVKALSRGSSDVMISIDKTETQLDEETGEEIEVPIDLTLPNDLIIDQKTDENGIAEIKLMDALLYTVQIYTLNKKLSDINIRYTSINEQQLIVTITDEIPLTYKNNIFVKITNRFNEIVIGMKVILNLLNDENTVIDTLNAKTNKSGIATLAPLNRTTTNEKGIAVIDGIRIEAFHENNYLPNITIEHSNSSRLSIIIPTELDVQIMKKIKFKFTNDEENEELRVSINDIRVYIYMNSELIYNDYPDSNGIIDIHSLYYYELDEDDKTDEEGKATIYENNQMYITYDNSPLKDVMINHINSELLILTLPDELELTDTEILNIDITNDDIKLLEELNNTKLKIYMPHYKRVDNSDNDELLYYNLIYNSYFEIHGTSKINIKINKLNIIKSNIDSNPDDEIIDNDIDNHFITYNPTRCAICKVISRAIDVTGINFNMSNTVIDIDDPPIELNAEVIPSNATYKDVSYEIDDEQIAKLNTYNELYGYKVGTTTITAYSVDNPDIKTTATIQVTSHRIQNITISNGNDEDYEWYDSLHQKIDYDNGVISGIRVTDEKYDDDDFARFYVPINNSIQLKAEISPSDAYNKDLKWLSSDNNLFRVTQNGIVTAIREGKQELDLYGDDSISESRFGNTAWITALNTKYRKYGICHVRATRNNITAINIPFPDEHDIDIDDMDESGTYIRESEHEHDYIIKVGETIEVPIELEVQDSNFGPSNNLQWWLSMGGNNIIDISDGTPVHANATDDFDWSNTTPEKVNEDKKNPVLKITGVNIGDVDLYATTTENTGRDNGHRLYVPYNVESKNASDIGLIRFTDVLLGIVWKSPKIKEYAENLKNKIQDVLDSASGEGYININGVSIPIGTDINEIIRPEYFDNNGVPITSALGVRSTDNKIYITIPNKEITVSIRTAGQYAIPIAYTFTPIVDYNPDNAENYIVVTAVSTRADNAIESDKLIDNIALFVNTPYKLNNKVKTKTWFSTFNNILYPDYKSAIIPSTQVANNTIITTGSDNPLEAKPGEGMWISGPKSRPLKIRVVATPKSLKIGFCNAWTDLDNIPSVNIIKNYSEYTINKISKNKYKYMCISFDDDFKDLLTESEALSTSLDEKYKSFAWFSDNEDVIRFEDVEDLSYTDEHGNYTNNPDENYQIQELTGETINLSNIKYRNFENYQTINNFIAVKLTDNYSYPLNGNGIFVNNSNIAVIRLHAVVSGTFEITHNNNIIIRIGGETTADEQLFKSDNKKGWVTTSTIDVEKDKYYYIVGASDALTKVTTMTFTTDTTESIQIEDPDSASFNKGPNAVTDEYYHKTEYTKLNDTISINVKGGCTNEVFKTGNFRTNLNAISTIKLTPISDGVIKISYKDNGITIKHDGATNTFGKNNSTLDYSVKKNTIYYITGSSTDYTEIESISYTPQSNIVHTGSYKGSKHFKVRPSRIKRVITGERGKANIYILSPKGQAVVMLPITVK